MSRYNLDSLDFDMADSSTVTTTTYNVVGGNGNVGSPQMLEADESNGGRSMTISIPGDRGASGQCFTVQVTKKFFFPTTVLHTFNSLKFFLSTFNSLINDHYNKNVVAEP